METDTRLIKGKDNIWISNHPLKRLVITTGEQSCKLCDMYKEKSIISLNTYYKMDNRDVKKHWEREERTGEKKGRSTVGFCFSYPNVQTSYIKVTGCPLSRMTCFAELLL